jgi:histidinol-phosphatase (PHP family)
MVEAALARGFHTLGFSGHSYTAFDHSFCLRDPLGYAKEIRALAREYEGQIKILLGTEWDLYGEVPYETEYVIGSVHYVKAKGAYYPIDETADLQRRLITEVYASDPLSAIAAYYACVVEMAQRLKPDIIGHFDVITKFNEREHLFDEHDERYLRLAYQAIDGVMESCRTFEVNTGAMFRGYRTVPYPTLEILTYLFQKGAEVTLSSDSHSTGSLDFGFDAALGLIARAGFQEVRVMTPTGWQSYPTRQAGRDETSTRAVKNRLSCDPFAK